MGKRTTCTYSSHTRRPSRSHSSFASLRDAAQDCSELNSQNTLSATSGANISGLLRTSLVQLVALRFRCSSPTSKTNNVPAKRQRLSLPGLKSGDSRRDC